MSIHRYAARRDGNEAPILKALRKAGYPVQQQSGKGIPDDGIYLFDGFWLQMDTKQPKRKLTEYQDWDTTVGEGSVIIARTIEDALQQVETKRRLLERLLR